MYTYTYMNDMKQRGAEVKLINLFIFHGIELSLKYSANSITCMYFDDKRDTYTMFICEVYTINENQRQLARI